MPSVLSMQTLTQLSYLVAAALFFLLPLYVMIVTSLKPMDEIRHGALLAWPTSPTRLTSRACASGA